MKWVPILIALVLLVALPGEAVAISIAPPGKSGADQYFETIPTSVGNAAPPGTTSGSSGSGSQSLAQLGYGRAGATGLDRLGKDGRAAVTLAAATAPTPVLPNGEMDGTTAGHIGAAAASHIGATAKASPVYQPPAEGQSAPAGVSRVLAGSDQGGLGLLLPVLLSTCSLVAIGFGVMRLRRSGRPHPS